MIFEFTVVLANKIFHNKVFFLKSYFVKLSKGFLECFIILNLEDDPIGLMAQGI
jgi:hypothetical protein